MATNCLNITKAFADSLCKDGMSGIKALWVRGYTGLGEILPDYPAKIDSATGQAGAAGRFYKFPMPVDIGDAEENATADPKLGTAFVDLVINGTLLGLEHEDSVEISSIMRGKQYLLAELYNLDTDGNPKYILYGEENGMDLTGGGSRTGAEASSLQGYELTWTGKEINYARFVDGNVVTVITGDAVLGDYIILGIAGPQNGVGAYSAPDGEFIFDKVFEDNGTTEATAYTVTYWVDNANAVVIPPELGADLSTQRIITGAIAQTGAIQDVKWTISATLAGGQTVSMQAAGFSIPLV